MKQKAFISYSIIDNEQYVLTLLANVLRNEDFQIDSSFDGYGENIFQASNKKIGESSLFIGLVTQYGDRNDNVYKEWQFALSKNIPNLLLVEDLINLPLDLTNHPNVIVFNRQRPQVGLKRIKNQIELAKRNVKKKNDDNALGWVLGGAAALAIIGLLSSKD